MKRKRLKAALRAVSLLLVLLLALPLAADARGMDPSGLPTDEYRRLHAVLVEWGEQNGEVYTEEGQRYVGVEFELRCIYSETFSESPIDHVESALLESAYFLVPEQYAERLDSFDFGVALIFLEEMYTDVSSRDERFPDGRPVLGARCGKQLDNGERVPAPIFTLQDYSIVIPDCFFYQEKDGTYAMPVMNSLMRGNALVQAFTADESFCFATYFPEIWLNDYFVMLCSDYVRTRV